MSAKETKKIAEVEVAKVVDIAPEVTDDIVVKDPMVLRPVELPLVVTLPEGASEAQVEYAKTLNAYAYQNPEKWAIKKDVLIARLRALKNAPAPIKSNLSYGSKNKLS